MRRIILTVLLCCASLGLNAAPKTDDFKELCDSMTVWASNRMKVKSVVELNKVLHRGSTLDFYFTQDLGDFPWRNSDIVWFRKVLKYSVPEGYEMGEIFVKNLKLEEFQVPLLTYDGKPAGMKDKKDGGDPEPTVHRLSDREWRKGLYGRHIALWQSHGRYYDAGTGNWEWQRVVINRTVEDLYTQSYVLKYLMPMLENAGANVFSPRERDIQKMEYVIDNDKSFPDERTGLLRRSGIYSEKGKWSSDKGFADYKREYGFKDNPFTAGTSRFISCNEKGDSRAVWTPVIEERGRYAVYVSYKSAPNSCSSALYTVKHLGGETRFEVNQKRGGGTWIYLGTFDFGPGSDGCVILSNKGRVSEQVSADAVRIGGGMGKVARGEAGVSGLPSSAEGALYSMVWSGVDQKITTEWDNDYTNDFADRGPWVKMLRDEKNIPVDMSLGFHSDAGMTVNDSIVGTLSIYTLLADGKRQMTDGTDRGVCRVLADYVQTQVCNDIRRDFDGDWNRRQLWNRSYSESRTSDVPAVLLELLSHQNFADMRLGLDPGFQFTASRAVYKGILKFLSDFYDVQYAVQPLPVKDFAARLEGRKAVLSWAPTEDPVEPTATVKGYKVYTRIDSAGFDNGVEVVEPRLTLDIKPGHIYSFKVEAWNDGGLSFPSEILSVGLPTSDATGAPVLIVNNFTRVSGPSWIDGPDFAGLDGRVDCGVPYINDISYVGEVYDFRRDRQWVTNQDAGCGATYEEQPTVVIAGNTFDYPYVHGKALMAMGYPFCSMSAGAFATQKISTNVVDLICGKQVTTMLGKGDKPYRYQVFTAPLRDALTAFAAAGGKLIVSGADIATDAWSDVYPVKKDPEEADACQSFIKSVLGYKFISDHGTRIGSVNGMPFYNAPCTECYCVENPDAIGPASRESRTVLKYDGTSRGAAVWYKASDGHKVASYGFPLETLKSSEDLRQVLSDAFRFLLED